MRERRLVEVLRHYSVLLGICAGVLVINLLFHLFVVKGQGEKIEALGRLYLEKRQITFTPEKKDRRTLVYHREKAALNAFREKLPSVSGLAGQAEELFGYIRNAGLSATMLNFRSEPLGGGLFLRYTTSFTVTGRYGDIKRMLIRLRNSPNLFCIEKLTIRRKQGESGELDMGLTLATYFSREKDEL